MHSMARKSKNGRVRHVPPAPHERKAVGPPTGPSPGVTVAADARQTRLGSGTMSSAAHFWVGRHAWAGLCQNPPAGPRSLDSYAGARTFRTLGMVYARAHMEWVRRQSSRNTDCSSHVPTRNALPPVQRVPRSTSPYRSFSSHEITRPAADLLAYERTRVQARRGRRLMESKEWRWVRYHTCSDNPHAGGLHAASAPAAVNRAFVS